MAEHNNNKFDVLVSGAGPVGLLLAYQLVRLGVRTCIIDSADKASPDFPFYGRACTLFPRTLELLDQLDLFDEMAQTGLVVRRNISYKDGKQVQGGQVSSMNISGTFFDFWLNIRLKYSEEIFRERVAKLGCKVQAPVKLVDFKLDEKAPDDYKVTSVCARPDGTSFEVKSKYIVGCDGGSSAVRNLAKIPFIGAEKEDHWVRIDGVVKTNVPDSRVGNGTIDSKTHGQVLFVALDHGATRIGYALSPALYQKYGRKMTQNDAIKEAKVAVAPFDLEFEHVDWHTVYVVKQFVAESFQDRERILLAGDAAHAHSSGTAQGMNVGCHDVVSLGWRLAGVINGQYKPEVLSNYSEERHETASHLIENDKVVSAMISGQIPERYKGRSEDPLTLLNEFMRQEWAFTIGLGVNYPANLLNDTEHSYPPIVVPPGHPAPDARLHKQGFTGFPTRLHEVTKYNGKFHILVFSGDLQNTRSLLKTLRSQVDKEVPKYQHAIEFRTIVCGSGIVFEEHLGVRQFGVGYWDVDQSAHQRYQISFQTGAVVVLRPDGILGFVAPLDCFERVTAYLDRLIVRRDPQSTAHMANGGVGELISLDENNLYYSSSNAQDLPQSHEEGTVNPQSSSMIPKPL